MPLSTRLRNYFPEYQFTSSPIASTTEAHAILDMFCIERGLRPSSMSYSSIDDFVEVLRYAPSILSNDVIAERTGITRTGTAPRRVVARSGNSQCLVSNSGGAGVSVQGLRDSSPFDIDRYQELVNTMLSQPTITVDSAQALSSSPTTFDDIVTHPVRQSPTLDDISAEHTTQSIEGDLYFNYSPTFATPKAKKKMRSETDMMKEIVRTEKFPRPNFKDFQDNRELEEIINDWYRSVEYKEHWIFSRREREGFNRRNIGMFNLDDVMARMNKRRKPHALDSSFSKFYDWKLGGTDWILRLELFQHEQHYFLITHHIHKPTDTEIKFDVRYWSYNKFKPINALWIEARNKADYFDRVFGSNDENSPYYVAPYEDNEDYEDYDEEPCDFEEMDWDDN